MYASFQNVLFVFDNGTDNDLAVYEYQLYEEDDIVNPNTTPYALKEGVTPLRSGEGNSSVFAVPVEGSYIDVENDNIVVQKNFFGTVRAKDTSGNPGPWTAIKKTDPSTPLIDSQYIVSLTADKIKAGTIESAEIVLGGANPQQTVIRSSTYDGTYSSGSGQWSTGSTGWLISGNGQAIFDATQIRGSVSAASINLNTHNYWLPSGSTATFKVGSASQYMLFDGTNLSLSGSLSAASGTFTGRVEVGGVDIGNDVGPGTGHYGISLSSGDFNNIFLRRSDGVYFFRVGYGGANSLAWDSSSGTLSVTGTITAKAGSFDGYVTAGGSSFGRLDNINGYYHGININGSFQSCFIRGNGGEVYFRADNGSQWIKFENGTVDIKGTNLTINGSGATFSGALSGASGSVGANFTIGDNLYVGNYLRINGPDPSNVTVAKIRGINNLGAGGASGTWTLVLEGPNGTNKWEVRDDGLMQYRTQSAYSDMRIKTNIQTSNLGLDFINSLKPRSYNLSLGENEEGIEVFKQVKTYGFVAQEVKEVYERYTESFDGWGLSVANDDESLQTVSYDNFISPLVKAIQELSAKVDELESRLI
jgi:hypothetical protein